MKRKDKQNKKRRNNDLVEVSVNVDVSKIVRNAAIAFSSSASFLAAAPIAKCWNGSATTNREARV